MKRQHSVLLLVFPFLIVGLSLAWSVNFPYDKNPSILVGQIQQAQAQQAINEAQTAINAAYTTLVFADSAGSPINDLISTLNQAISDLNHARRAYNQTDYTTATTLAEGVESTANAVNAEAQIRGITTVAQIQAQILFVFAVVLISIPTTYFVVSRWQEYRKAQRREFLQMEIRLPDEDEEEEKT